MVSIEARVWNTSARTTPSTTRCTSSTTVVSARAAMPPPPCALVQFHVPAIAPSGSRNLLITADPSIEVVSGLTRNHGPAGSFVRSDLHRPNGRVGLGRSGGVRPIAGASTFRCAYPGTVGPDPCVGSGTRCGEGGHADGRSGSAPGTASGRLDAAVDPAPDGGRVGRARGPGRRGADRPDERGARAGQLDGAAASAVRLPAGHHAAAGLQADRLRRLLPVR